MTYTIDTSQEVSLDWNATGNKRIVQNVFNLMNTFKYEVAYARAKGINAAILDKPASILESLYASELYRVIGDYESRVTVKSVKLSSIDAEGNANFRVVIEI